MQFSAGQTVVHPQHGPSTVTQVVHRSIKGVTRSYVELAVHRSDLCLAIPVDTADDVGLRPPRTAAQLEELWDVLREASPEEEEQWSRRMKGNQEKLRIGDLSVTAGVVRDLVRRDDARGISPGERDMLKNARQPLIIELGLSLGVTDAEAERLLDSVIRGGSAPEAASDTLTAAAG